MNLVIKLGDFEVEVEKFNYIPDEHMLLPTVIDYGLHYQEVLFHRACDQNNSKMSVSLPIEEVNEQV